MTGRVPLGEREGQRLEFKERDALANLFKLGRVVVAFLNSGGGTVWIGVREEDGIAVEVEGLDDAASKKNRLLDSLVDSIEPAPTPRELSITVVDSEEGDRLLRVDVSPDETRGLRHLKKGSARLFVERIDHRIRNLSWEEITDRVPAGRSRDDPLQRARQRLLEERKRFLETDADALWLRILAARELDRLDLRSDEIRDLLTDPAASGNRPHGWNPVNPYREPVRRQGRLVQGGASIHRDGSLGLQLPLDVLDWKQERALYPYALLEYPVSMFRIARVLYRARLGDGDRIVADLALSGLDGWKLRPYSPTAVGYLVHKPASFEDDFALLDPPSFDYEELAKTPDLCAVRLVEEIYEFAQFPVTRNDVPLPPEFDYETGRLMIAS